MLGVLESDYRPATDEEIRDAFGAGGGSLGPVGVGVEVVADEALREGQFVAGANRDGWHLLGVEAGRDYEPRSRTSARLARATVAPCAAACSGSRPRSRSATSSSSATRYSEPLDATFLDEDGAEKPLIGGSYGVGPARVMAAVVEQRHDENGIVWPKSIAPYDVHVLALHGGSTRCSPRPRRSRWHSARAGLEVLLDDRDERRGRSSRTPI